MREEFQMHATSRCVATIVVFVALRLISGSRFTLSAMWSGMESNKTCVEPRLCASMTLCVRQALS